jgi:hypothetical protein
MVIMGECDECGHRQPGVRAGDAVEPLADSGCANCDGTTFAVPDEEEEPRQRRSASRIRA